MRAIKNIFTGTTFVLEDTIQRSKAEYEALRSLDDTVFKEGMREIVADLVKAQRVVKHLSHSFDSKIDRMHAEIARLLKDQLEENRVIEETKHNSKWFQSGQIAGQNIPRDRHNDNIKRRYPNSCKWIFEKNVAEYQTWVQDASTKEPKSRQGKSSQLRMLWLHGNGGVGKSILISTIMSELQKGKHLIVYFFCKLGDEWSQNCSRIMLHLCAQLFWKGSERNLDVQRKLNEVMRELREDLSDSGHEDASNVCIATTKSLFQKLANTLRRNIIIVVDGLDECVDLVDSGFLNALKALAGSSPSIRVLVSSRITPDPKEMLNILVDKSKTENDIRAYVTAKTKTQNIDADWVIDDIVKRSEGRFRCE